MSTDALLLAGHFGLLMSPLPRFDACTFIETIVAKALLALFSSISSERQHAWPIGASYSKPATSKSPLCDCMSRGVFSELRLLVSTLVIQQVSAMSASSTVSRSFIHQVQPPQYEQRRNRRGLALWSSGRQQGPWLRHLHGPCWCPPLAALFPCRLPLTLGVEAVEKPPGSADGMLGSKIICIRSMLGK